MQFQILPEDYIAAVRLNYRPRRVWAYVGSVVLMLAAIAFLPGVWDLLRGRGDVWDIAGLVAIAYFPTWYFVFLPRRIRKLYKQQRVLHEPHEIMFDATGISTTYSLANGTLPWSHVHKWRESKDLLLVYHSDAMFSIFPKRHFDPPSELDRFRELLASRVGPANNSFKPNPLRGSA